jgi:hypothetical protein
MRYSLKSKNRTLSSLVHIFVKTNIKHSTWISLCYPIFIVRIQRKQALKSATEEKSKKNVDCIEISLFYVKNVTEFFSNGKAEGLGFVTHVSQSRLAHIEESRDSIIPKKSPFNKECPNDFLTEKLLSVPLANEMDFKSVTPFQRNEPTASKLIEEISVRDNPMTSFRCHHNFLHSVCNYSLRIFWTRFLCHIIYEAISLDVGRMSLFALPTQ